MHTKYFCQNILKVNLLFVYVILMIYTNIYALQIPFTLTTHSNFNQRRLSVEDGLPPIMILIKVYIGSPLKEYNLIFDTMTNYTMLLTNSSTLSKASNPYYIENSSTSKIQNGTENTLHIFENSYGVGCIVQDQITPKLLINPTLFKFILMNEYLHNSLYYNADGIAGFNYEYNQNIYSILDAFYTQRAITKKIFAFKFNTTDNGILYIGEDGMNGQNDILLRSCSSFQNVWGCSLSKITVNQSVYKDFNYELNYNAYIRFSTSTYPVEFPLIKIEDLLLKYKNALNTYNKQNNCLFKKISTLKEILVCDNIEWYPNQYLPGVSFVLNDNQLVLELQGKDLFTYSSKHGYVCNIQGNLMSLDKGPKMGLVILKNYHTVFNKDQHLIQFTINPITYISETSLTNNEGKYGGKIIIVMLIIIIFAFMFLALSCRRKHRRNIKDKITFNHIHEINTIILNN